jgi:hypothetical protein
VWLLLNLRVHFSAAAKMHRLEMKIEKNIQSMDPLETVLFPFSQLSFRLAAAPVDADLWFLSLF